MHPRIFQEFESICAPRAISGTVLEVGAVPSERSLLCMRALSGAIGKVGINIDGPHEFRDFRILRGSGNDMRCFEDDRFDVVLCNAMIEHDRHFWKTLAEIRRVTRPGGLIVIGGPGFRYYGVERVKALLGRMPLIRNLRANQYLNVFFTATVTFEVHDAPGDYYRFSPQAFREVVLEGLENREVRSIMLPPRLIGVGTKPAAGTAAEP